MNLVTADLRQGFNQGNDFDTGLNGMVSGDQPNITTTDDQHLFRGFDQIAVDKRLECAGTINPRQGVPRKRQHFFPGAGGN